MTTSPPGRSSSTPRNCLPVSAVGPFIGSRTRGNPKGSPRRPLNRPDEQGRGRARVNAQPGCADSADTTRDTGRSSRPGRRARWSADDDTDFLRRPVLTSRNVRGGRVVDVLLGGPELSDRTRPLPEHAAIVAAPCPADRSGVLPATRPATRRDRPDRVVTGRRSATSIGSGAAPKPRPADRGVPGSGLQRTGGGHREHFLTPSLAADQ